MRWIALFNIAYGGLGLAAALYLGRTDGVLLCLWVMGVGAVMRTRTASRLWSLMGSITRRAVLPVIRRRPTG